MFTFNTTVVKEQQRAPQMWNDAESFSLKKMYLTSSAVGRGFIIKDMSAFPDLNNLNLPFSVAFFKTFMAYSWPASGPVTFLTRNTFAKKEREHI